MRVLVVKSQVIYGKRDVIIRFNLRMGKVRVSL